MPDVGTPPRCGGLPENALQPRHELLAGIFVSGAMDERHVMILLSVAAFFAGVSKMAEVRVSF